MKQDPAETAADALGIGAGVIGCVLTPRNCFDGSGPALKAKLDLTGTDESEKGNPGEETK